MGGAGTRGGGESTFPLKPRRNVGGFPEIRPRPPAGRPPLTWTSSPGSARRGVGAHLGGRGQILFRLPPAASRSGKGGCWKPSNLFSALGRSGPTPHASVSLSVNKHWTSFFTREDDTQTHTHPTHKVSRDPRWSQFFGHPALWAFAVETVRPAFLFCPPSFPAWQLLLALFGILSPGPSLVPFRVPVT